MSFQGTKFARSCTILSVLHIFLFQTWVNRVAPEILVKMVPPVLMGFQFYMYLCEWNKWGQMSV